MEVVAEEGGILDIWVKRNPKALFTEQRKFGRISGKQSSEILQKIAWRKENYIEGKLTEKTALSICENLINC